jgi:predicted ATPase
LSRAFKVGIAGTHSTGKSTFIRTLRQRLVALGVRSSTVSDLATEARGFGFPILRDHTFESTAWIITRGIALELEAGVQESAVLVDRPVPDALGYLRAALKWRQGTIDPEQKRYLEEIVKLHSPSYQRLFLTTLDVSIPVDLSQERDTDPLFRQMAADEIALVFEELRLRFCPLPSEGRDVVIDSLVEEILTWTRGTSA